MFTTAICRKNPPLSSKSFVVNPFWRKWRNYLLTEAADDTLCFTISTFDVGCPLDAFGNVMRSLNKKILTFDFLILCLFVFVISLNSLQFLINRNFLHIVNNIKKIIFKNILPLKIHIIKICPNNISCCLHYFGHFII